MIGYPLDRVYQEVAYLGRQFHWPLSETLNLDHAERVRWVREALARDDDGAGDPR